MPVVPLGPSLLPPIPLRIPLRHALDTIQESDEAMVDFDMHAVAKSVSPTLTIIQSDDVPVPFEVQQPVQQQQQQQQKKRSILELTQSVTTIDLGMEQPMQQQAAPDIVSQVAADVEQRAHMCTHVQQPADGVEGAVVSGFEQQRAGAEGCSMASSQEGPWSIFNAVSDICNCCVGVRTAG